MNIENINYLIDLMQEVIDTKGNFNIDYWQSVPIENGDGEATVWDWNNLLDEAKPSIEEIHSCGYAACLGGYLAVSEKFKADGGAADKDGEPIYQEEYGEYAIAKWLDIDIPLGEWLSMPVYYDVLYSPSIELGNPEPAEVINRLQYILNNETGVEYVPLGLVY